METVLEEVYDKILNGDNIKLRYKKQESKIANEALKKFNELSIDITEEKLEELIKSENHKDIFLLYGYLLKNNLIDSVRKKKFKTLRGNNFYLVVRLFLLLQKYRDGDIEKKKIYRFIKANHTQLWEFKELRDFIKYLSDWSEK